MITKEHFKHLPVVEMPTEYPRDSEKVAISIPIFHSPRGWVGNFDENKNFDTDKFKEVVCKGAAWVALSVMTNTDLCKNGVPIYFHVEDVIFDETVGILKTFGVPDDWIKQTSFSEPTHELEHTRYGKKLGVFADESIETDAILLLDADALFYRPLGDPVIKLYHHFDGELSEVMMTSFYSDYNGGDESFVNWVRLGAGLPNIEGDATAERLKTAEKAAYNKLGLETPDTQHRYGAALLSLPRKHPLFTFLRENMTDCYPEEALVSAWMNSVGCPFLEMERLWNLPFLKSGQTFLENTSACIAHPYTDDVPVVRYIGRLRRGIDGRHRKSIRGTNRSKKRVVIWGVPHNPAHKRFSHCAFAQKARKLVWKANYLGHETLYFGNEMCDVDCTEKVVVTTVADLEESYPGFMDQTNVTSHGPDHYAFKKFFLNAEHEYRKRAIKDDILCYVLGWHMHPLFNALQDLPVLHVESGIGYYHAYMHYKVFESASVRDFTYGIYQKQYDNYQALSDEQKAAYQMNWNTHVHHSNPQWQDTVIPNSFDAEDFDFNPKKGGDYAVYIGRVMPGKGIEEAMRICDAIGIKFKIAGNGCDRFEEIMGFAPWGCVELVGPVGVEERNKLYFNAAFVFYISRYLEPFGGGVIEAFLCGRPVLSTDFGAHHKNVRNGVTGFRLEDFNEGVDYAKRIVEEIEPEVCREWGLRFSKENIAPMYDRYFDRILRYHNNKKSIYWVTNPDTSEIHDERRDV